LYTYGHKIYQIAGKCKKWPHLPLQNLPKVTQIGLFGLKIYHLATLAKSGSEKRQNFFCGSKRIFFRIEIGLAEEK
jgi:hypothetical protein